MSFHDPTTEQLVYGGRPGPDPTEHSIPVAMPVADDEQYLADDDEEWVSEAPKGLRVRAVTGALLLLLFAVCGFWGGAVLQKHHDKSTTGTSAAAATGAGGRAAAAAAAAAGGAGFGGGAAGAGGAAGSGTGGATGRAAAGTSGIVTDIQGSTLYLTDGAGALVKVTLSPSSVVNKTAAGSVADIQLGQTVTVTGAKAADGSTTARSVTISPAAPGAAAATPAGG